MFIGVPANKGSDRPYDTSQSTQNVDANLESTCRSASAKMTGGGQKPVSNQQRAKSGLLANHRLGPTVIWLAGLLTTPLLHFTANATRTSG
jgi:hypothetical protein